MQLICLCYRGIPVSNLGGSPRLSVLPEPAVIVEKAEPMQVTVGDACTLECKVAGTPELSVGWFKDGKELTSSHKYRITFHNKVSTLKILDSEKEDSGLYTFAVQNDVGKSSCTASVDVLGWLGRLSSVFHQGFL